MIELSITQSRPVEDVRRGDVILVQPAGGVPEPILVERIVHDKEVDIAGNPPGSQSQTKRHHQFDYGDSVLVLPNDEEAVEILAAIVEDNPAWNVEPQFGDRTIVARVGDWDVQLISPGSIVTESAVDPEPGYVDADYALAT